MPDAEPDGAGPMGMDGTTMLAMGGFVLVFALIVVGATFMFTPIMVYMCGAGGVLPGAVAVAWGLLVYRREKHLNEFSTFLKEYRRISMADLSKRLGMSRLDAERTLTRAIQLGYVKGVVDRSTDEFVLAGSERAQVFIEKCPHCGGVVNRWAFPEERFPCPYCNVPVEVPAPAPPAR